MPLSEKFIDYNRRLSDIFTNMIGLGAHENFLHHNEVYFQQKLRENILMCKSLFGDEPLQVLDIGCGRHTHLESLNDLHHLITAFGMDISAEELNANTYIKNTIIHDACREDYERVLKEYKGKFHLIISHNVLEHVPNPDVTHAMINFLLRPEGMALHSYPTLFDPLMTLSHLLPLHLAEKILFLIEPFRAGSGKFKTYYRKNRCFSDKIKTWFESLGFTCIGYRDYYGTAYFYAVFPLQWIMDVFYWIVLNAKLTFFTSHSIVTLQKNGKRRGDAP